MWNPYTHVPTATSPASCLCHPFLKLVKLRLPRAPWRPRMFRQPCKLVSGVEGHSISDAHTCRPTPSPGQGSETGNGIGCAGPPPRSEPCLARCIPVIRFGHSLGSECVFLVYSVTPPPDSLGQTHSYFCSDITDSHTVGGHTDDKSLPCVPSAQARLCHQSDDATDNRFRKLSGTVTMTLWTGTGEQAREGTFCPWPMTSMATRGTSSFSVD